MEHATKSQIRLLKTIANRKILAYDDMSESQKSECEFLNDFGFVSFSETTVVKKSSGVCQFFDKIESVFITESGKAYLSAFRADHIRYIVPIVISNAMATGAIIISIISLLKP